MNSGVMEFESCTFLAQQLDLGIHDHELVMEFTGDLEIRKTRVEELRESRRIGGDR